MGSDSVFADATGSGEGPQETAMTQPARSKNAHLLPVWNLITDNVFIVFSDLPCASLEFHCDFHMRFARFWLVAV